MLNYLPFLSLITLQSLFISPLDILQPLNILIYLIPEETDPAEILYSGKRVVEGLLFKSDYGIIGPYSRTHVTKATESKNDSKGIFGVPTNTTITIFFFPQLNSCETWLSDGLTFVIRWIIVFVIFLKIRSQLNFSISSLSLVCNPSVGLNEVPTSCWTVFLVGIDHYRCLRVDLRLITVVSSFQGRLELFSRNNTWQLCFINRLNEMVCSGELLDLRIWRR